MGLSWASGTRDNAAAERGMCVHSQTLVGRLLCQRSGGGCFCPDFRILCHGVHQKMQLMN
jgi:hypothetical protein